MFEGKLVKVSEFTEQNPAYEVIPTFCDLDRNGHVNNIRYADYVLNALGLENQRIGEFQLDFHREIQRGMKASLYVSQADNTVLAKGIGEGGEKMFSCAINLE